MKLIIRLVIPKQAPVAYQPIMMIVLLCHQNDES